MTKGSHSHPSKRKPYDIAFKDAPKKCKAPKPRTEEIDVIFSKIMKKKTAHRAKKQKKKKSASSKMGF